MTDRAKKQKRKEELIGLTAGFCDEHLNQEYKELCEKLISKMARKHQVPFLRGNTEIWAASIIHALGSINFLFDKDSEPYVSADDICAYFGTAKNTISNKARLIRNMFNMNYWDNEFSTSDMLANDPFAEYVEIDGFVVNINALPPELQELIRDKLK